MNINILFLDDEFSLVMLTSKQGELSIWKLYGNVSLMLLFKKKHFVERPTKMFQKNVS